MRGWRGGHQGQWAVCRDTVRTDGLGGGDSGWGGATEADASGINLSRARDRRQTLLHIFGCTSADQLLGSQQSAKL